VYAAVHRQGDYQGMAESTTELAWSLVEMERLGEFDGEEAAAAALDEAAAFLQSIVDSGEGKHVIVFWAHCQLAMIRARQGQLDGAHRLLAAAPEPQGNTSRTWYEVAQAEAAGNIAVAEERWQDAASNFQRVVELSEQREQQWHQAHGLEEWASALIARGTPQDLQQAQRLLEQARTLFEQRDATYYVALVRRRLAQIQSRTQEQAMAMGAMTRELAVAGRIQEGLLPQETPYLPGWQLAATLEPARETSGDFYDFVRLGENLLGIVIADVADKGAGAALYMALTRTLLRNYAAAQGKRAEEPARRPADVLRAVNERILSETSTDMFVTLFYAVIEADSGTMAYANAGHNPPFLLRAGDGPPTPPELLRPTGMALGVIPDSTWREGRAELGVGDTLVLYTDGAIDAQRADGQAFGQARLLVAAQGKQRGSAQEIEAGILTEIHQFVGSMPRFDDLTLVVVARR
jgi:sigma-B regulation protein RsbU (phosphoserine phosphatase)